MRLEQGTWGRRESYKVGRIAAAAMVAAFIFVSEIRGTAYGGEAAPRQILLKADEITYDSNARTVSAHGHVEISDEDRSLLADEVTYDEVRDVVSATGNVSLQDATGNVAYADHVELTQDLREGALQGFAALIGESGRLAATSAERHQGRITIANGAVFTPCNVCREEGGRQPLWQIRAARVVHDHVVAQRVGIRGGHRFAELTSQLEHCLRTQRPIEVTVQLGLRQAAEQFAGESGEGH